MSTSNDLPRIFQNNIDRLFQRVILRGFDELRIPTELELGEPTPIDESLLRVKAQVDNYTVNEAAKAYALVLAGLFERQLRIWAQSRAFASREKVQKEKFKSLLVKLAEQTQVDLDEKRLGHTLVEMFLVANVYRHGDGGSAKSLLKHSPGLWDFERLRHVDLLPPNSEDSEKVVLGRSDIIRYAYACAQFWGCADKGPGAVTDPPYGWPFQTE